MNLIFQLNEKVKILDRYWLLPEYGYVTKIREREQYQYTVQPEGMLTQFVFREDELEKIMEVDFLTP